MVTKPVRVVKYREELPPIKLHDPLAMRSFDFVFLLYDL